MKGNYESYIKNTERLISLYFSGDIPEDELPALIEAVVDSGKYRERMLSEGYADMIADLDFISDLEIGKGLDLASLEMDLPDGLEERISGSIKASDVKERTVVGKWKILLARAVSVAACVAFIVSAFYWREIDDSIPTIEIPRAVVAEKSVRPEDKEDIKVADEAGKNMIAESSSSKNVIVAADKASATKSGYRKLRHSHKEISGDRLKNNRNESVSYEEILAQLEKAGFSVVKEVRDPLPMKEPVIKTRMLPHKTEQEIGGIIDSSIADVRTVFSSVNRDIISSFDDVRNSVVSLESGDENKFGQLHYKE